MKKTPSYLLAPELIAKAVEVSNGPVTISDNSLPDNPIVYANKAFYDLTGYEPREVLGRNCRFLQCDGKTDREKVALIAKSLKAKKRVEVTILNCRKNGEEFWNHLAISPLKDASGKVTHFIGVQFDASQEIKAKNERDAEIEFNRSITNNSLAAYIKVDQMGRIEEMNPSAERLLGHKTKEVSGRPLHNVIHHSYPDGTPFPAEKCPLHQSYVQEKNYPPSEVDIFKKNGDMIYAVISSSALNNDMKNGAIVEIRDVTIERRALDDASIERSKNYALVETNRIKDEFIAIAAHELRTPLTATRQYIGMVRDGLFGDLNDAQSSALEKADKTSVRQAEIISNLLKVVEYDDPHMQMTYTKCDIWELIAKVTYDPKYAASAKRFEIRGQHVNALINEQAFALCIDNLLSNALKYSKPDSTVAIEIREREGNICVCIRSLGVYIPVADRDRIFQKFVRLHNAATIQTEGTGLGLYLVRAIISHHQGTIAVRSNKSTQTTEFSITLPPITE